MKPQASYKAALNRAANAFPRSISFPYGEQAMGNSQGRAKAAPEAIGLCRQEPLTRGNAYA